MSLVLILELLLKSGLIAGVGLALAAALDRRPAAERVDILRATVVLLIALPPVMAIAPDVSVPLLPELAISAVVPAEVGWAGAVEPAAGGALAGSIFRPSPGDFVLCAWAAGAALVLGRFALGVWTLWRWTRQGRPVSVPAWIAPLDRLAPGQRPSLIASAAVGAPLSWGVRPGVVLIGDAQLTRPETARAVLAHELAHLKRGDWAFLVLSRLALGLFWFNPLVWLLHGTLAARSEEAADAVAIGEVDRRDYARALVDLASDFTPPAALGMAGPAETLTRRIACIMKPSLPLRRRPLAMAVAVGALIAVATPIAALELTPREATESRATAAPTAALSFADPVHPVAAVAPVAAADPVAAVAAEAPVASDDGWFPGQDAYAPPPPPPPPPAPPAPPAPYAAMPAPPAPPIPPAPPARAPRAPGWVHSDRPLTAQERQAVVEARQAAVEARIEAREARREAMEARVRARARPAAAPEARVHARAAVAEAAQARARAGVAREHAARELANARVHMARGADQMVAGAEQMRQQAARLRDPAYRATQIEQARERGETVTDAELQALAPRLAARADGLERRAVQLRERAARQPS